MTRQTGIKHTRNSTYNKFIPRDYRNSQKSTRYSTCSTVNPTAINDPTNWNEKYKEFDLEKF